MINGPMLWHEYLPLRSLREFVAMHVCSTSFLLSYEWLRALLYWCFCRHCIVIVVVIVVEHCSSLLPSEATQGRSFTLVGHHPQGKLSVSSCDNGSHVQR